MNYLDNYNTRDLEGIVSHYDDIKSFQEFLSHFPDERETWKEKINQIIQDNHYTKAEFAKLCSVSKTTVSKWCNGSIPNGRDGFIKIGFAAHYNLDEMNTFLQRYGKYPVLYAKSLEDNVYIFVLNSSNLPHTYTFCQEIISNIKNEMEGTEPGESVYYNTQHLNDRLLNLKSTNELVEFVKENASSYKKSYSKLYAKIKAFIIANNRDPVTGEIYTIDSLAELQHWSSSLRQCVSKINQKKWFPMRRKVIALGLHLNMTVAQINELLQLAQMETLCAKNLVESAIIYAVEDADLNELICCDGGSELCEHVRKILEKLNIPDAEDLINDI